MLGEPDSTCAMKSKGKIAWLVTWEGPESEHNGRCKVVAILRPQLRKKSIASLLPVLFCSEYGYITLCEKLGLVTSIGKDQLFRVAYGNKNPEFLYGDVPKQYLSARKVENLRCEKSKKDCFETTLYWTESPKFIPNPDVDPNGPMPENPADLCKQVIGEREAQYTYSIREGMEDTKRRIAEHQRL